MKKKTTNPIYFASDKRNQIKLSMGEGVSVEIASEADLETITKKAVQIAKLYQPNPNMISKQRAVFNEFG